jgi:hypothetical protein
MEYVADSSNELEPWHSGHQHWGEQRISQSCESINLNQPQGLQSSDIGTMVFKDFRLHIYSRAGLYIELMSGILKWIAGVSGGTLQAGAYGKNSIGLYTVHRNLNPCTSDLDCV